MKRKRAPSTSTSADRCQTLTKQGSLTLLPGKRKYRRLLLNALLPAGITEFEKKVYLQVCRIPRGRTRSYRWIAEKINRPKAYRAVGNALNKNPHPGIIPCHRVVRSDGGIGGFSRGIEAKKRLLRSERLMV